VVNTISWYDSFNWASPRQHKDNTRGIVLDAKARHLFNYEPFPNSQSPIPNLPSPPPTIVSQNVPPSRHHFIQFSPILPIFPPKSTHRTPHVSPFVSQKTFPYSGGAAARMGPRPRSSHSPCHASRLRSGRNTHHAPRIPTPAGPQHAVRNTQHAQTLPPAPVCGILAP
jgi:hypothetical protein